MNPADLARRCVAAINSYTELKLDVKHAHVTLVFPKGWKPPPKFPRGELCCYHHDTGDRVRSIPAMKLLAWLTANGFVQVAGRQ